MAFSELLSNYFLRPIISEQSYNYINTIAYALVTFASLFLLSKLFKRNSTKIDLRFFLSLIPLIILGSFARSLVDAGEIQRGFWLVAPGIYLLVALVFFVSYLFATWLEKSSNIETWKTILIFGSLPLLMFVVYSLPLQLSNLAQATVILLIFVLLTFMSYFLLKTLGWLWAITPLNFTAIAAQLFDATNTAFLVEFFGAVEKHPLPRTVIDFFGSGFAFYPLKIIVILFAIYILTKDVKDKYFKNTLVAAIAVLGLAQGMRNILTFILI